MIVHHSGKRNEPTFLCQRYLSSGLRRFNSVAFNGSFDSCSDLDCMHVHNYSGHTPDLILTFVFSPWGPVIPRAQNNNNTNMNAVVVNRRVMLCYVLLLWLLQVSSWRCSGPRTAGRTSSTPTARTTEPTWRPVASCAAAASSARSTDGSSAETTESARMSRTANKNTVSIIIHLTTNK